MILKKKVKTYTLLRDYKEDQMDLTLMGENNQELIRFKTQEIYDKFYNYQFNEGSDICRGSNLHKGK